MSTEANGRCPVDHRTMTDQKTGYIQPAAPEGMPDPESLRQYMFDWYQKTGFRGCLFNKVAARDARRGDFTWHTPVEYDSVDDIISGDGGQRIIDNFNSLIGDAKDEGLVSYMFPGIESPHGLGDLLKFLHYSDSERFQIFDTIDRERIPEFDNQEFIGIQFRIKLGENESGQDIFAYPMIYNPWEFTTFARRFDIPKITFNAFSDKQNPETPDTFIGVDDIDMSRSVTPDGFAKMLERSITVNRQAHSMGGSTEETFYYSRKLFRAHNALVLPASAWED